MAKLTVDGLITIPVNSAEVTLKLVVPCTLPEVAVIVSGEAVTANAVARPELLMLTLEVSELLQVTLGMGLWVPSV